MPAQRIVHVYKDVFPPVAGGVERAVAFLGELGPDFETVLLSCSRSRRTSLSLRPDGALDIRVWELGRVWSAPLAPGLVTWVRRLRPDLIHVHMPNPPGELAGVLSSLRTPIVCTYHAQVVRQRAVAPVYERFQALLLGRAARLIVGSPRTLGAAGLDHLASRTSVIPYCVDDDFFSPAAARPAEVAHLRERFQPPIVVGVGRLVYYKGFENLIRAVADLDATLLIVGDGPLRPGLRGLASTSPRVHLLGQLSDHALRDVLAAADCFALPSTSAAESFGLATIEAQAMAVPAVVTDVGTGTTEAIAPGVTGLVVRPNDVGGLRDAIRSLLGDRELRERFAPAARERAKGLFGVAQYRQRHVDVYRSVIG